MRRVLRTSMLPFVLAAVCCAVAVAAVPDNYTQFMGTSKHKRFQLSINTECTTTGCRRSTTVVFQVNVGSVTHPSARCPSDYTLRTARIKKGGFSASGTFAHGKLHFSATGTFTAPTHVTGKVIGPRQCGGTDTYSLTGQVLPPVY